MALTSCGTMALTSLVFVLGTLSTSLSAVECFPYQYQQQPAYYYYYPTTYAPQPTTTTNQVQPISVLHHCEGDGCSYIKNLEVYIGPDNDPLQNVNQDNESNVENRGHVLINESKTNKFNYNEYGPSDYRSIYYNITKKGKKVTKRAVDSDEKTKSFTVHTTDGNIDEEIKKEFILKKFKPREEELVTSQEESDSDTSESNFIKKGWLRDLALETSSEEPFMLSIFIDEDDNEYIEITELLDFGIYDEDETQPRIFINKNGSTFLMADFSEIY